MLAYVCGIVNRWRWFQDQGPYTDASLRSLSDTAPHGSKIRFDAGVRGDDMLSSHLYLYTSTHR